MLSSNDHSNFKPDLVLVSFETSRRILFIEEPVELGPPWIDSITAKWLSKIDSESTESSSEVKIFFYRENLGIIEEIQGHANYKFETDDILVLYLDLEKTHNILKPRFHNASANNEFELHSKIDKVEYKLLSLSEDLSLYKEKSLNLEARLLSIEKDDYIKQEDFYLWRMLSKDNFRGLLILLVSFLAIEMLYKDILPINKILRGLLGVPEITDTQDAKPRPTADKKP